jgi:hypothetical protein
MPVAVERARKKGTGRSKFRTRLHGHTRDSSAHKQATFAFRLAVDAVGDTITDLPTERANRARHPKLAEIFLEQKRRVNAMQYRWVEILDDFEAYIFEASPHIACGPPTTAGDQLARWN